MEPSTTKFLFFPWRTLPHHLAVLVVMFFAAVTSAAETGVARPDSTQTESATPKPAQTGPSLAFVKEHTLSFLTIVLPHNSLRNSKTLHNWPFFAFSVPGWKSEAYLKKDFNPLLSVKVGIAGDAGFGGINTQVETSVDWFHLLELGIQPNLGTALNYGETATFMGTYNPEKKDYDQDAFFTEYIYGVKFKAALTIPLLMALLPKSDWTKIILKATGEYAYNGYTNADDGEVWKVGSENMVNGFRYRYGGVLIYILPFQYVPMAMVSFNVSGFKHAHDFNPVYKDYNPGFKTISITPMLSVNVIKGWNGMLMAAISRDRTFENRHYETTEEILQKQIGSEWDLRAIMFILSRKF